MEYDLVVEGKAVLPDSVRDTQLGITDGIIRDIKRQGLKGAKTIRAAGCLVFPGFIDAHVHLREPGWESKEDFRTGTRAAVHGGVTTVLDMPNNPRPTTDLAALLEKERLASSKALVDVRFFGGVKGETLSNIVEMREKVIGYKMYLARTTGGLVFEASKIEDAFSEIAKTGRPASMHCEDQSIIDAKAKELSGQERPDIYCDLRPPSSEVESVKAVAEVLKGNKKIRANVCHTSTKGALDVIIGSRSAGSQLYCEAALHHLFFNRTAMLENRLLRTNPPLRPQGDRGALVDGLKTGAVNFLVTDHAPHAEKEKISEGLAGVPGLDDYGHLVVWLLKKQGLDPMAAAKVTSTNPATFFGLKNRGEIKVGKRADLSILDMGTPEKVTSNMIHSKCGWSPYEGIEFPGKIRWTVRGGVSLMDDFQISG